MEYKNLPVVELLADYDCHVTTPAYKSDHWQYVYVKMTATGNVGWQYGIFRWNTSSIPVGSVINSLQVKFHVEPSPSARNVDYSEIINDPLYAPGDVLVSDVDDGPIYQGNQVLTSGVYSIALGAVANVNFGTRLAQGYWALSVSFVDPPPGPGPAQASVLTKIRCTNPGSGANPRPTLRVDYTP